MTTPTFDARFVADHQDFLQRLARGLLGTAEGHDVDDAVQETWRLALEGPRAQQPRAFLATVLRRSLGRSRARERAREVVEARGARSEVAEPTLAEDVERRLALNEELARALRALPEAQRIVLFLRFHADLPLAAIAARVGAPVPTVKTRITRGLAALREDLDRRYSGERSAWAGLLVLAVDRGGATKGAFAGSTSAPAFAAGLVALVLVGAIGAWLARLNRAVEGTLAVESSSAEPTFPASAGLAVVPAPPARTSVPSAGSSSAPVPQDAGTARVRARFVDSAGAPVADVPVVLTASVRSAPALFAWGEHPEVAPLQATSNENSVVEVLVPAIPCLEWQLAATPTAHARVMRRWPAAARDSLLDLDELALEAACSLTVTVVDAAGAPSTCSHRVHATERVNRTARNAQLRLDVSTVDGVARFAGLPPRRFNLQSDDTYTEVDLTAGGHVELTLRPAAAGDPTRVLAALYPDLRGRAPASAIRLVDGTGVAREASSVDDVMGRATWLAVPEGVFTLTFDAPGFEPWSQGDVLAGGGAVVRPRPRSGIRLSVTDASGTPVGLEGGVNVGRHLDVSPEWQAVLNEPGAVSVGPEYLSVLHLHRTPLQPLTEFRLLPGAHRLAVFGPRARRVDIELTLGVDELRDVEVVVEPTRSHSVSGTVLDAQGAQAAGATVELLAAAEQEDGRSSPVTSASTYGPAQPRRRKELGRLAVGADGRFEFTSDAIGPLVVRAWSAQRLVQSSTVDPRQAWPLKFGYSSAWIDAVEVSLEAGEARHDLVLRLPSESPVQGTLEGLAEFTVHAETLRGVDLVLRRAEAPLDGQANLQHEVLRRAELGPGSGFRFEGVTPGVYDLVALLGGQPHAMELFPRQHLVLGRLDVPAGGLIDALVTPLTPLPAPVDVRIECTGAAPGALSVFAQPTGELSGPGEEQLAARASDGVATLPIGRAGTWTFVVVDLDHGWAEQRQVELTSTTSAVQFDIELAVGTLRVVDAAGSPRQGVTVAPARLSIDEVRLWSPAGARTDANGAVTLRLPVGSATLTTKGTTHALIPWPPAAGTTLIE